MEFGINTSDLPLMINGLIVHNTRLDSTYEESRYAQLAERVHIGPHDNQVTISYSIADYNKPDGNRYQYLLEGLYDKWHYVGNQTELVLPHLPPGDYRLLLRGAGSDGRWSTQQAAIPISVHAAYYNTWWFRLTSVAILALIMWLSLPVPVESGVKIAKNTTADSRRFARRVGQFTDGYWNSNRVVDRDRKIASTRIKTRGNIRAYSGCCIKTRRHRLVPSKRYRISGGSYGQSRRANTHNVGTRRDRVPGFAPSGPSRIAT